MVLLARVRALLRRAEGVQPKATAKEIRIGKLFLNSSSQTVMVGDEELEFTTQEFALLWQLALNVGTILSRDDLFKLVRGIDYDGLDRSIDVRISRIRKKLGDDPRMPYIIKTVWGRGYLLSPDAWND
jgi:DNA-binding response OmpR family regulator